MVLGTEIALTSQGHQIHKAVKLTETLSRPLSQFTFLSTHVSGMAKLRLLSSLKLRLIRREANHTLSPHPG